MELATVNKIISAIQQAGITSYDAVTDTSPCHYYQNDKCFNVIDDKTETIYNFGPKIGSIDPFDTPIVVKSSHLVDIHEIRFGGTVDQIKKFAQKYGITFTNDQLQMLVNINGTNYNLKPETGDYFKFTELTQAELDQLSSEKKVEYQVKLAEYKKHEESQKLQKPVRVTVG